MQPSTTETIWQQLSGDLRRFIRRRSADDHIADDLLQETFLRIHSGIGTLRRTDRLAAWVYQIARNVIHDHHRQASRSAAPLADDPRAGPADGLPQQLSCQAAGWLEEMIRQLPEPYRQAVRLSEIEGLPQRQLAERLGLSHSGAKSRVQRGRAMLRDALDACCTFEFDRRGNMLDYQPRPDRTTCRDCDG